MIPRNLVDGLPALERLAKRGADRAEPAREITTRLEAPFRVPYFIGRIRSSAQISGTEAAEYRWAYTVDRAHLTLSDSEAMGADVPVGDDGETPLLTVTAYNLAEWLNTDTVAQGITVADLEGVWSPQPIEAGSVVLCFYVERFLDAGHSGEPSLVVFDRMNPWDGGCA